MPFRCSVIGAARATSVLHTTARDELDFARRSATFKGKRERRVENT
jgi:hypothetical protein